MFGTLNPLVRAEERLLRDCEACQHVQFAPAGMFCRTMQLPCEDVVMSLVEHGGLQTECVRFDWAQRETE
jgi:hypothetical protein